MSPIQTLSPRLARLAAQAGASRLVLFGSRARGDCHDRSDIDLAIFGMPAGQQARFALAVDELPTLLKFDLVFITPDTNPHLIDEIEKDGVLLYEAAQQNS